MGVSGDEGLTMIILLYGCGWIVGRAITKTYFVVMLSMPYYAKT